MLEEINQIRAAVASMYTSTNNISGELYPYVSSAVIANSGIINQKYLVGPVGAYTGIITPFNTTIDINSGNIGIPANYQIFAST